MKKEKIIEHKERIQKNIDNNNELYNQYYVSYLNTNGKTNKKDKLYYKRQMDKLSNKKWLDQYYIYGIEFCLRNLEDTQNLNNELID